MGLIGLALPPANQQATILAAPDAVSGLANNGQGASVMGLIGALPPKSQAAILAAPDAVWGLANNGQGASVMGLIGRCRRVAGRDHRRARRRVGTGR